jgi:tRNA(Ile)-lysidine synthase
MDAAVLAWMEKSPRRAIWSVAFSGGPDSLALLLLLWAHWPERRGRLRALHFNHRLRGPDSAADAAFCRRVCRSLGIEFRSAQWKDAPAAASEAAARAARMAFFQRQGRTLFLGHQQDDIAESMLMRLARGSGAGGLAAPRPVQILGGGRVHLRPLLALKKREILAALRTAGVQGRIDATNRGPAYFRNRVRRGVIPAWVKSAERDAVAGAARSRSLLEEDDAALEAWVDELQPLGASGDLDLGRLAGRPRAVLRRSLHRWLLAQREAGEISRQAFELLLDAATWRKNTRQSLGRNGFAVMDGERLWFEVHGRKPRKFPRRIN